MQEGTDAGMPTDVTLVQVFGEFREFRGSMSTRMRGFERELRAGLDGIKEAVDKKDGKEDELAERLTAVEGRQALMYKIISAVGGVALLLLAEAARRIVFGG